MKNDLSRDSDNLSEISNCMMLNLFLWAIQMCGFINPSSEEPFGSFSCASLRLPGTTWLSPLHPGLCWPLVRLLCGWGVCNACWRDIDNVLVYSKPEYETLLLSLKRKASSLLSGWLWLILAWSQGRPKFLIILLKVPAVPSGTHVYL